MFFSAVWRPDAWRVDIRAGGVRPFLSQWGRLTPSAITRTSQVHPFGLTIDADRRAGGPADIGYGGLCLENFIVLRAISSVGERFVHTEEVRGSKPRSPTALLQVRGPVHDLGQGLSCPARPVRPGRHRTGSSGGRRI